MRNPQTGVLIGNSPFMNGLIGLIMALFLVTGIAYGIGAKTVGSADDVIGAMTKAVSGLGGTILLFVVISQFVDYFNYSNIPTLMAVSMADVLKAANIGALWLLIGFIVVVMILDFFFTPRIAKWAIFAPVFVPLFVTLTSIRQPCWRPTASAIRPSIRSRHSTPISRWWSALPRNTTRRQASGRLWR